jgi:hypothetical protein
MSASNGPDAFVVTGAEPSGRYRPRLRYELIACGLHGHELPGTDAGALRPEDGIFARETEGPAE